MPFLLLIFSACPEPVIRAWKGEGKMEENKFVCERCKKEVHVEEKFEIGDGDGIWCLDCRDTYALKCDHCRDYHPKWSMNVDNYASICDRCFNKHYFICKRCENICHNNTYDSDGLCDRCYNEIKKEETE